MINLLTLIEDYRISEEPCNCRRGWHGHLDDCWTDPDDDDEEEDCEDDEE